MKKKMAFKDRPVEELRETYHSLSKQLYNMRNEVSTSRKIEKPHLVRLARRDRARVLTYLRQKGETIGVER